MLKRPHVGETRTKSEHKLYKGNKLWRGKKKKKGFVSFRFFKKKKSEKKRKKLNIKIKRRSGQRAEVWRSPISHCMSPYSVISWILCEQFVFFLPSLPKSTATKTATKTKKRPEGESIFWAVFANGVFQFRLSLALKARSHSHSLRGFITHCIVNRSR